MTEDKIANKDDNSKSLDIEFLSKAMEAFNEATINLSTSYELLEEEARKLRKELEEKNKKLEEVSGLLQTVMDSSISAVIATNGEEMLVKNKAADKIIQSIGTSTFKAICKKYTEEGVYEHMLKNGTAFRLSVGVLGVDGINGYVYIIDDITNLKKLEDNRQRSEKLELMGEMAANIAHEIRNPLGSMELFISLLDRELTSPEHKKIITNTIKAIRTINATISNTLLFTKEIKLDLKNYYLSDIIDDVVLYLQHILKEKKISIINKLGEEHRITCDKDLFHQVIINIIRNSIEAVENHKGVITLESKYHKKNIIIIIKDNGCGIANEIRNRLFMPFQTNKAKGTGLGLSIAYKIIKAHNGDINVESSKKGTEFQLVLPLKIVA